MRNPRSGSLVALLLISGAVLFVTWPQGRHLSTKVGGDVDALFSVWRLAWIADSLASAPAQVFDAPIFYPHKNTLAYSDAILLSGVITAPFRWLGVAPFAVYNVYLLVAIIASGFTAALLCHRLTASWFAAAVGGVIFTINPHRMEHFERLELLTSAAIPFAFYCWHVGTRARSTVWVTLAFVCLAVQWYLGMYQALFLATVTPCLLIDSWTLSASTKRLALKAMIFGTLLSLILIAPSTIPYVSARQNVGERTVDEVAEYSAELTDFAAVPDNNWLYGQHLSGRSERHLFPGGTAVVLAALGFFAAPRNTKLLYGLILFIAVQLTLGSNGFVFPMLREIALPYRALRVPARAAVIVMLPVAVFASIAVARLLTRLRAASGAIVALGLIVVVAIEYRTMPELWDVPDHSALVRWTPPAGAVLLDYPIARADRLDLNRDAHYMVARIGDWPPMLNGYSGHYPDSYVRLLEQSVGFPRDAAVDAIRRRGATHIAIHEVWLEGRYEQLIGSMLAHPAFELVGRYRAPGGEVSVFRLHPT